MRKTIVFFACVVFFCSCKQEENNSVTEASDTLAKTEKTPVGCDTVIASFMSCTECSDLYIWQGKLCSGGEPDIEVTGNFPKELIDMTSPQYNPFLMFRIIGTSTKKVDERIPVFEVTSYEQFYFERHTWTGEFTSEDLYKERSEMVTGLLKYFKFKGEHINFYRNHLGRPDFKRSNSIGYRLSEGNALEIKFSTDSIITQAEIVKQ